MSEMEGVDLSTVLNNTVFSKLGLDTQERILSKNIVFQGDNVRLKDVLTPSRAVDHDEFIDSELLSKLVNNELIKVGAAMGLSDTDWCCCYISRSFDDREEVLSEEQLCEYQEGRWCKIITIMSPPGSGKSTVLNNIAVNLKKNQPHLWVIKIDLKNYSEALSTFKEQKKKPVSVIDLLNSKAESRIKDGLERKIFNIPHKVVLFIDGIDEVSSDYMDIMKYFMSDYHKSRNLARVYVASSNNMDETLQAQLWSRTQLVEFSHENQILLLKNYLERGIAAPTGKEKCKIYEGNLIRQWFHEDEHALVGVPLQIRMLGKVLCGIENWKDYYEFLSVGNSDLSRPKKINLVRLYLLYIHSCCENKTCLNEDMLREDIAKLNKKYSLYVIAMEEILTKKQHELFYCDKRVQKKSEELLGLNIVKKVGDILRISHRTVAEYFLADRIAKELRQTGSNKFFTFYIETILTKNEFRLVRLFLDSFIGTVLKSISDRALKDIGYLLVESDKTVLHYLLQEGCVETFKLLFKCLELAGVHLDLDIVRLKGETLLQTAISAGQSDMMELLMEKGASVKSRDDNERTALYNAVNTNNLGAVYFLVGKGAEVHCRDLTGRTLLHEAAAGASLDIVEYLLSRGVVVNSTDKQQRTPLHAAVKIGNFYKSTCLMKNHADVNIKAKTGTPIFTAISESHVSIVSYLLEYGSKVTVRNENGATVLHKLPKSQDYGEYGKPTRPQFKTFQENAFQIFKLLIRRGADVNAVDKKGNTGLHSHIDSEDNIQLIKLLVENGAEINRTNKNGFSALHLAIRLRATEIVKYLVERDAPAGSKDLLLVAVAGGYLDVVKYFTEKGFYLNFQDEYRYSLLHTALGQNDFEMVKYLVENGVDVNAKSYGKRDGITVIANAINNCSIDIVKFLIERGAAVEGTLELAAARGDMSLVKFLEDKGVKAKKFHNVGRNFTLLQYLWEKKAKISPLFVLDTSAEMGDLNIIKYLIDKGVDVYMTEYGPTLVLHKAAKHGHLHIVKLLLKHGGDIDCKDWKGETPLNKAFRHENMEIAEFLVEKGADINNVLDENRGTLLQVIYSIDKFKFLVDHIGKINISEEPEKSVFVAAMGAGCFEAAEYLVEKTEGNDTIVDIVNRLIEINGNKVLDIFNRWDTVRYLLERGICVDNEEIEKYNLLTVAASKNDFKYVKYLVEKGANVNQKDEGGCTALHKASDFGIVKYLVGRGADVNAKTKDGWSVLHEAVKSRNFDLVRFLVENGAGIHAVDNGGNTVLYAATKGTYNKAKYLLKKGARFTIQESNEALRNAVNFNDLDLVEWLIENGAEIEDRGEDERTAIFKAVDGGNLEMVKYFVKRGANINVQDKNSVTLFQHAVAKGDLDIVRYLTSSGVDITKGKGGRSVLHVAVSNGDVETVRVLLEYGVDVAAVDEEGRTVLHEAAKSGDSYLVEFLINHGAGRDFEVKDKRGRTVLQEVFNPEGNALRLSVLKVLVKYGADVNSKFEHDRTLLHEAVLKKDHPVVEYLVEQGAEINSKSKNGRTALMEAAAQGSFGLVQLLVDNGADADVQDGDGFTALHEAARSRDSSYWFSDYVHVMEFLIKNGSRVNVRSRDGHSPLEDAVANFDTQRIKVLVDNGAKLGPEAKNYGKFLEALQKLGIKR